MKQPTTHVTPSVTRCPSLIRTLPPSSSPSIHPRCEWRVSPVERAVCENPSAIAAPAQQPASIHLLDGTGPNALLVHSPQRRQASGDRGGDSKGEHNIVSVYSQQIDYRRRQYAQAVLTTIANLIKGALSFSGKQPHSCTVVGLLRSLHEEIPLT